MAHILQAKVVRYDWQPYRVHATIADRRHLLALSQNLKNTTLAVKYKTKGNFNIMVENNNLLYMLLTNYVKCQFRTKEYNVLHKK